MDKVKLKYRKFNADVFSFTRTPRRILPMEMKSGCGRIVVLVEGSGFSRGLLGKKGDA